MITLLIEEFVKGFSLFNKDGEELFVDGFMIKNPYNWRSINRQPLFGITSYSGVCNMKCKFCYEVKGLLPWENNIVTYKEVQTRVKIAIKNNSYGFPGAVCDYLEPFTNTDLIPILSKIRTNFSNVLSLSTNGYFFTEQMIKKLTDLKPLLLHISLNSSTPNTRSKIMKDIKPNIAIESLELLKKYNIQYQVTIVAWPDIKMNDIEQTVLFANQYDPLDITIHLPGYTKYHATPFDDDYCKYWDEIVELGLKLRAMIDCPLKIFPSTYYQSNIDAIVEGIYKNSPAYYEDINVGDKIININGVYVNTRSEALRLLEEGSSNKLELGIIKKSNGKYTNIILNILDEANENVYNYPNKPYGYINPYSRSGLYMNEDIELKMLLKIQSTILGKNYKSILIVSSKLISKIVYMLIDKYQFDFYCNKWDVTIIKNNFFGGNICLGDLATVNDYIITIEEYIKVKGTPDAVFIPSSFLLGNGMDLIFDSYTKIERKLGIPVELVKCNKIFD